MVSDLGISTDPAKMSTISIWPTPTNCKQLQAFLGLASYYRHFVKDFAKIARPLHRLTEANSKFTWDSQCQNAFDSLRQKLVSAPVLALPDFATQFILDTDASDDGIGAVLFQRQKDGSEHVIACASRSLTKPERKYSVTRRELLAVVTFTNHFRQYLIGTPFKLRTDHNALVWLRNFKNPEGQLARWLEKLEEFSFSVEHRAGNKHHNADALSRRPATDIAIATTKIATDFLHEKYPELNLVSLQQNDSVISPVLRAKETKESQPSTDMVKQYDNRCRRLF